MKSCVPCGKYILAVFVMRKIKEIVVFLMINSMCSLCRIRYGNFFVFVVDGVLIKNELLLQSVFCNSIFIQNSFTAV